MTVYDSTMTKIRQWPESLVQAVNDFVEFLLLRNDSHWWQRLSFDVNKSALWTNAG